jgi:hypothetical protein
VQALVEATRQGFEVPEGIVERAMAGLDLTRGEDGYVAYSARRKTAEPSSQIPGAIGRMVAVETVRSELGRNEAADLRRALAAFVEHWEELLKRKEKTGTHQPPYGVAPYYFFYAFTHAAAAGYHVLGDQDAFACGQGEAAAHDQHIVLLFSEQIARLGLTRDFLADDETAHGGGKHRVELQALQFGHQQAGEPFNGSHLLAYPRALKEMSAMQSGPEDEVPFKEGTGASENIQHFRLGIVHAFRLSVVE